MVLAEIEVVMAPVDITRDGDLLMFEYEGEFWPVPIDLARRLASDAKLILAIRNMTNPGLVRRPKKEDS